jgi:hypothetical protein
MIFLACLEEAGIGWPSRNRTGTISQMSFSSKWGGRPVAAAATSSASARSARLSANQDSATRSLTDSLGHPAGQQVSGAAHGDPLL